MHAPWRFRCYSSALVWDWEVRGYIRSLTKGKTTYNPWFLPFDARIP